MTNTWKIILYKKPDWTAEINVKLEWNTIWLNQNQIANLFDVNQPAIAKHLKNIFDTWELDKNSVHSILEYTANDWKVYKTNFYNLDAIISVGYRVNSKNATAFRIRATTILKNHLLNWYSLNENRIKEIWFNNFEKAVALIKRNIENNVLRDEEVKWMLSVITEYAHSRIILQKYDEWSLKTPKMTLKKAEKFTYEEAMKAILDMKNELLPKKEVSESFWNERNDGLKWIINQIYQSFDWVDLYPTIQEKAAALMYFTIKDHPFVDGNKKIWAFLLLIFLWKNNLLRHSDWTKVIDENTLIALTLLVSTSEPSEKEMILLLITHFIS